MDGQLDGNATFAGTISDPRADVNLKVSNMGLEKAAGLAGIDINTTGHWRNGRLALDGNATSRKRNGIDMKLQAEVPLVLRQEPLTVELPRTPRSARHYAAMSSLRPSTTCSPRPATGRKAGST